MKLINFIQKLIFLITLLYSNFCFSLNSVGLLSFDINYQSVAGGKYTFTATWATADEINTHYFNIEMSGGECNNYQE